MFTFPNKIIAVSASRLCPRPLEEQVPRLAQAGIKKLILREKQLDEDEYLRLAEKVLASCEKYGVELTIHFFPHIAEKLNIHSLHMPLGMISPDMSVRFETLGCSVHSLDDVKKAKELGANRIIAGHIFETDCKKGLPPRGLDFLSKVCKSAGDIPVCAIGGINEKNISDALGAGASGVCMMSEMMKL